MQGLPTNLLTPNVVSTKGKATDKMNENSSVGVNGKVAGTPGESKGVFASIFSGLLGNAEAGEVNVEGENTPGTQTQGLEALLTGQKTQAPSANTKAQVANTSNVDALLKTKEQEQIKKSEVSALNPEKVLSAEVLQNVNNLIDRTPMPEGKGEKAVGEKVAATSSNLDQLLKTLKGDQAETPNVEGEMPTQEGVKKAGSPLDFLVKESKTKEVGSTEIKKTEVKGEMASKLGLSSEDFLNQLSNAKDVKAPANFDADKIADKLLGMNQGDQEKFDPNALLQKQMNQSMKSYGQKQNLLSDNIIRSPKDLMNKESKLKSSVDELKSPDMKVGAELASLKDPFIAVTNKQDQNQNNMNAQGSEKVLDLSKMNSTNPTEIIKKISDYIQQSQVANKDQLDLTVKHDSLGQFKIQVNKPMGNNNAHMDMQITTTTAEGHDFFMKHEIGLMKNLSQAGIQLSDLRIVSEGSNSSFAGMDSRQQGSSQYNSQNAREFMSFDSGDSSNGSQRRKELWQEAQNQQRYGA